MFSPAGSMYFSMRPGDGQEVVERVLRVDPELHGVALRLTEESTCAHILVGSDVELHLDQVQAGDHLGDRVLHLDTGVGLQEVQVARLAHEELERPQEVYPAFLTASMHRSHDALPQLRADGAGGRLLDDLLVTALHGAFPLAQAVGVAARVADHLELDVPVP